MKRGKINPDVLDELYAAVLCLETTEECRAFFEDLCTVLELQTLSQRLQVAKMLRAHHVYSDIVSATGASTATISRVNRSLNYQSKNGYDIVFQRMQEKQLLSPIPDANAGAEPEDMDSSNES